MDWARAEGTGAPRLCALLGDVGMGKTTTAKLFTQRLLGLRAGDTITWFLLALSFLLRGLQAGPPVLADVIGLAGLGIYLAFLTAYVLSSRPSSKRG